MSEHGSEELMVRVARLLTCMLVYGRRFDHTRVFRLALGETSFRLEGPKTFPADPFPTVSEVYEC